MHSRIFQVSKNPIHKIDYIEESNYYDHWFTNEIADYVDGGTDRDDDIQWLDSCAKGYEVAVDDNGYYFVVNNKEQYFAEAFNRFKEALVEIGEPTIEDFIKGIDLWKLKDANEDKFGFYVDYDGFDYGSELLTFDRFMRMCELGTKYYIGGTIDYHW